MTPRRIAIVTSALLGYTRANGIGTATTFLALALSRMGHHVEALYYGAAPKPAVDPEWARTYSEYGLGVRVISGEEMIEPSYFGGPTRIAHALLAARPDVVIAQEFGAPAYSALRLRSLGLAFGETLFVVQCHGTRLWSTDASRKVRVFPAALGITTLERASLELADIVVSPSAYLVGWMCEQGWHLPDTTRVIPYLTRSGATLESPQKLQDEWSGPIQRLAFFGRVDEERKGLRLFIGALNGLEPELLDKLDAEFLTGTASRDRILELLSTRTRRALRAVTIADALDHSDALARVSRPGTVVVIPSTGDNSPNTVYECLEYGIPFIASAAGGIPELVAAEDRSRVLFDPSPKGINAAIRHALSAPRGVRAARPAFDPSSSLARWADVVETARPQGARDVSPEIEVDIVVVRAASQKAMSRCLAALRSQTAADFRTIVGEGATVEAARQAGLRQARAPFVLFLDEEDVPDADLLATLFRAQTSSNADVVTCGVRVGPTTYFFPGEPRGLAALANGFGKIALIRRSLLGDMADVSPSDGDSDWPLLARLAVSGARIVSVPLPLVTCGLAPGSIKQQPVAALLAVRQLERPLPDSLTGTARLAAGLAAAASLATPQSGYSRRPVGRRVLRRLLRRGR